MKMTKQMREAEAQEVAAAEAAAAAVQQRKEREAIRRAEEEKERQVRIYNLLTGHERNAIAFALRIAIEKYQDAIEACGAGDEAARLRAQFDRQIVEAETLVEWMGD